MNNEYNKEKWDELHIEHAEIELKIESLKAQLNFIHKQIQMMRIDPSHPFNKFMRSVEKGAENK